MLGYPEIIYFVRRTANDKAQEVAIFDIVIIFYLCICHPFSLLNLLLFIKLLMTSALKEEICIKTHEHHCRKPENNTMYRCIGSPRHQSFNQFTPSFSLFIQFINQSNPWIYQSLKFINLWNLSNPSKPPSYKSVQSINIWIYQSIYQYIQYIDFSTFTIYQ